MSRIRQERQPTYIKKLAEFARDKKPVPWVGICRLPDHVWFSRKIHMKKSTCETCHRPVAEPSELTKEKPITMSACMACHDETEAPNECNTCHNP